MVALAVICSYGLASGDVDQGLDVAKRLDVAIVVEGSPRMKEVDPSRLFAHAGKMFVALLGVNDRVGVIRYVDKAEQLSALTVVGSAAGRDALFKAIDSISWQEPSKAGNEQTGKVNVQEAIDSAVKVLTGADGTNADRVIILLYNAKSGIEGVIGNSSVIETLKGGGIRVFAIAVGDKDDKEPEKSGDVLCKPTGGLLYTAHQASGIYMRFASIFENLTYPMMIPIESSKINIDESISAIAFVIKKNSPTKKLSLDNPDGVRYLPEKKPAWVDWLESDTLDVIRINEPEHGTWTLNFGYGRENKAYIWTSFRLMVNMQDPYQDADKPLVLETWFKMGDVKMDIKELQHGFNVKAAVVDPDGSKKVLQLEPKTAVKGSNVAEVLYSNSLAPMKEGKYEIEITATGKGLQRRRTLVLVAKKHEQPKTDSPTTDVHKTDAHKTDARKFDRRLDKFIFVRTTKNGDMSFKKAVVFFMIINIVGVVGIVGYTRKKGLWKSDKLFRKQVEI
ncbi:von Willebrand factor type A domain protein [Candidatus Magnetobacterium bavaricum]|uniref:von Willebrand factor type A domain protein n=1 Tax=Candidatus Magnetobacterium bavaricum TaxID=29290 RepID=A0A0F3GLG1_9BACT|nr:von Willebrand factor type A domain protein [Candidatus Magnetobacterium bavaricum]